MKNVVFNFGAHTIVFKNDLRGTETVTVNGEEVSKKFSWFGTKHTFNLDIDGKTETFTVKSKANLKHYITISFYDGKGLLLDEDHIGFRESLEGSYDSKNQEVSALLFIALAIILDWNYAFLAVGIVFLILSLRQANEKKECTTKNDEIKKLNR